MFAFMWEAKYCAHVRRYDLTDEADVKRLRIEQLAMLGQPLLWPIYLEIEADVAAVIDDGAAEQLKAAQEVIAEKDKMITRLSDELKKKRKLKDVLHLEEAIS